MKIKLDEHQRNALIMLGQQGGTGAMALKRLLEDVVMELSDVTNIDSKANMGLQALARQHAVEMLREVYQAIWPIGQPKMKVVPDVKPKESQYV